MRFLILAILLIPLEIKAQFISSEFPDGDVVYSGHTDTPYIIRHSVLNSHLDTNSKKSKNIIDIDDPKYYQWGDTVAKGYPAWMSAFIDTMNYEPFLIDPEIIELPLQNDATYQNYIVTTRFEPCYSYKHLVRVKDGEFLEVIGIGNSGCAEGLSYDSKTWLRWNAISKSWDLLYLSFENLAYGSTEGAQYSCLQHFTLTNTETPLYHRSLNYYSIGREDTFIDSYLALFGIKTGLKMAVTTD